MNQKTKVALVLFLLLGAGTLVVLRAPEKGERSGPAPGPMGIHPMKADQIDEMEVTNAKERTTLKKEGNHWMVVTPVHYPADADGVKAALDKLGELQWGDVLSEQKAKAKEFEVDDEKGTRIVVKQGGQVAADFYLGKAVSGFTMARPAGSDAIWQLVGSLKWIFAKDTKGWRNKVVTDFKREDIETVQVEAAGKGKVTIKRVPGDKAKNTPERFEIAESPNKIDKVDDSVVQGVASSVGALRAADFADGAKPEETGLDKPAYTIQAKAGAKTHTVSIGKQKGDNYYVSVPETPQVFLVPKHTIERLAKPPIEFRDKTLADLKPEDLVQVDVAYKDSKFALEKSGNDWKAKRPSGLVVDPAKASAITGAFQSLRAASFADTTDPKTTGLDKPTATVTARTKDKKSVTLEIGAVKGEDAYVKAGKEVYLVKKYQVDRFFKTANDLKKGDETAKQ